MYIDALEVHSGYDIFTGNKFSDDEMALTATAAMTPLLLSGAELRVAASPIVQNVAKGLHIGQKIEGIGTVIANNAGQIKGFNHNTTYHGLDQIISRGVSPDVLLKTVQNPLQRFAQSSGRTLYLSQQAAVILDKAGQVVTSFTSNQFYSKFSDLINQITSKN